MKKQKKSGISLPSLHYGRFILIVFFLGLPVVTAFAQRNQQTINDGWKFHPGDFPKASAHSFNDKDWESVSIPHTWNTDAYVHKDYYKGRGWYRVHKSCKKR